MRLEFRFFVFAFILLVWASKPVMAQKITLKEADALFKRFQYALALPAYQQLTKGQKPTLYLTQQIAECYRQLNKAKETETWYNRVLQFPEAAPEALKHAADAARKNSHYEQAKQHYLQYGQRVPEQAVVANQLAAACDSAQQWLIQPQPYELQKPRGINSSNSDFSPVVFQNNLVFTSDRPIGNTKKKNTSGWTGKPFPKLYSATKQANGQYGAPQAFDKNINNKYHNGSATFSADGQTIYFTRINQQKGAAIKTNTDPFSWVKFNANEEAYINRLEIFVSRKKDQTWGEPEPFPYNNPEVYSVGHPALSPDEQTLYLVSDMPGGLGQTDIYYCTREANGNWSKPVNAGKLINTSGKESFPTVSAAGKLYFSSERHPGMGGLDIFEAEGARENWKNLKNLKFPLNSPADDFGITFDETQNGGFLSSNRNNADGTDDVYAFNLIQTPCTLAGKVIERIIGPRGTYTESPVSQVLIRAYVAGDTTALRTYSDAQGNFSFPVKSGAAYTIRTSKEGYLFNSAELTPDCGAEVNLITFNITLNRNTLNNTIVLENIYYDFDKANIRPEAMPELDKLVRILQDNPTIRIELGSHTDSRQTVTYNQRLSQSRAEAAVEYMISKGVSRDRLIAKGYGESQLLNDCKDGVTCSELEHQINRRTVVKILSR
ncbi:OmpA family protein [Adhaeribacter pallidiroseus]|uniref:Photosystem I P700 chlorophyll a apoprotein A2 n=1 Tax=Adhaeribacter pallidiroseus TaxID=2072847 RepID=A0A369QQ71_9BACT|nr:OmpA family protein [Adhaeribacter pallidiroseus]RDC65387.1 Photosystem I P700 chlorophyll a apoprotein A2 [Adhaeribacter pallidiroseus]